MANPTTNYGFVLPTATDLVTDLPADFDVALQGVDTRLKALQPGTTLGDIAYSSSTPNVNARLPIGTAGQVLSVVGGVPAWVASNPGDITAVNAGTGISGGGTSGDVTITNSMATAITTNGDLIYGTGSGTFTRRGIGSTGDVLTVSGGVPTWSAPPAAGGMTAIASGSLTGSSVALTSISGSYKDLVLRLFGMSTSATTSGVIYRFNNDAGNVYRSNLQSYQASDLGFGNPQIMGSNSQNAAGTTGFVQMYLTAYTSSTWKMARTTAMTHSTTNSANFSWLDSVGFTNLTAAINRIDILLDGGTSFDAGTYILYGVN